jgi:hypothetical protein
VENHLRHGPCAAITAPALLPCPAHDGRDQ